MSSCIMKTQDSDEEGDLEALRLAALKSRKPRKITRVNHNNLIPIVPVPVETPDFLNKKIKVERVSPPLEGKVQDDTKAHGINKENEGDNESNYSESIFENDDNVLNVDDKEEEDSLEKLMDELEAEISGKSPLATNRIVLSSKNSSIDKKDQNKKKSAKSKKDGDDEVELVQVKTRKEPGAIIEIRESASPENVPKETRKSVSPVKSPDRRSRSRFRTRSRSPFIRGRSYRRSRSPYWSKSPRRSKSPFRRSRSPFWMSRRSRSSSRKSRSPFRRYRSPGRKFSPFSRFSRSRSRSFDRRRSPWSLSPRRRSKSPYYRDGLPSRRKNFNSPSVRSRRSFSPRDGSKSPRRRSRSPRRFLRNSPLRRSKSPYRRSRSPVKRTKSPLRRSQSPFLHRSKSPISKLSSPNRSPFRPLTRRTKSPARRSLSPDQRPKSSERSSSKPRSKSPPKKYEAPRRSPRHASFKGGRSLSISTSPTRRNRSPLRVVEKNKLDEKNDMPRERYRNDKRHRSLSRENRSYDRRPFRQRYFRRFSPSRNRKSAERQGKKSKSPKQKETFDKNKEETRQSIKDKGTSPVPAVPADPVLEARKKKFETLCEVDPTVDKKISLKSVKESTENAEDDEDTLTINVEDNLWDESEESEDEFESRFKSGDARKNRTVNLNRTVLSFRNLREGDALSKKINLNKPLIEDNRRERFGRNDRYDRWQTGKRNDRRKRTYNEGNKNRSEEIETNKNRTRNEEKTNSQSSTARVERRPDRKPIIWSQSDESKVGTNLNDNEVSTTQSETKENKSRSEKTLNEVRERVGKDDKVMRETDDFDKLISDFEKELESDICLSTKEVNSAFSVGENEVKRPKISIKKHIETKPSIESTVKKPIVVRAVRISEASSNDIEKKNKSEETRRFIEEEDDKLDVDNMQQINDEPEDYIEDDDFVLEVSAKKKKNKEEEDSQSDLRAVLSRRRNERLTKAVSLQENMPTRLVQSAFQGLGNKKSKRENREVPDSLKLTSMDKNWKNSGVEGRRVLLLQRDKNPSVPSVKCTVPEVKPDTTITQRFTRSNKRRKRKLQRQLDPAEDLMDQEEEEEGYEVEEEKHSRRFRLKRNVTLSSQYILDLIPLHLFCDIMISHPLSGVVEALMLS